MFDQLFVTLLWTTAKSQTYYERGNYSQALTEINTSIKLSKEESWKIDYLEERMMINQLLHDYAQELQDCNYILDYYENGQNKYRMSFCSFFLRWRARIKERMGDVQGALEDREYNSRIRVIIENQLKEPEL